MVCPWCGSGEIIRKGKPHGKQRFYCKNCKKFFSENPVKRRCYPKEYKIKVVRTAIRVGISKEDIWSFSIYNLRMDERTSRGN